MFSVDLATSTTLLILLTSTLATSTLTGAIPFPEPNFFKRDGSIITMGLAQDFAALAATTLTSTGLSALEGNAGVNPGTAITGFPPATITGTLSSANNPAKDAQDACLNAYNTGWAGLSTATTLPSTELAGFTLTPGIYKFPAAAVSLTGTLTLSGGGTNQCGNFIFLIETTFTSSIGSEVLLKDGASACSVYFLNGSSATIGAGTKMKGNVISFASITAGEGAENEGSWCALNAAITLINNKLTAQGQCGTA